MSGSARWLAIAVCLAAIGLFAEANAKSAKIYVDDGWVVDGDVKHEIKTVTTGSCNSYNLQFGTNAGLIQVDMFKEMPEVYGFISQQVNWSCGGADYNHTKCPGSEKLWVSRKLGAQFVLFCLGQTVGFGH
jgi:hypothetical protein